MCDENISLVKAFFVAASFMIFTPVFLCLLTGAFSVGLHHLYIEYILTLKLPEYWDWALMFFYGIGIIKLADWSIQGGMIFSYWTLLKISKQKIT